jgi:hypothetical protein
LFPHLLACNFPWSRVCVCVWLLQGKRGIFANVVERTLAAIVRI